jgi:hypothetical protein
MNTPYITITARICRLGGVALAPVILGALLGVSAVQPASAQEQGEQKSWFSKLSPFQKPKSLGPTPDRKDTLLCPAVLVQPGTAALILYERGKEGAPLSVRYQVRFSEFARECVDLGAEVGLRVGLAGRALVGPKGVPGQVIDVPIRFVVLDDQKKVVISRVTKLQVTIPVGQTGITFTHVEEMGTVPKPENKLRNWDLRVGFDTKPVSPQG